jgi:serine/threonine protein kinase
MQDFQKIGNYQIIRKLGSGAYGHVFLEHHPLFDRQVSVKVFLDNVHSQKDREQFLNEVRV